MTLLGPPNQISKKGKGPSGVKSSDVNKIAQPPDHCPNNGCRLRKYFDFRSSTTVQVLFSTFLQHSQHGKTRFRSGNEAYSKKEKSYVCPNSKREGCSPRAPPGSGIPAKRGTFSFSCLALIDLVFKVSYLFIYLFILFIYLFIYLFIHFYSKLRYFNSSKI